MPKSTMLTETSTELDTEPLDPVIVIIYIPRGTVGFTKTVIVEVADPPTARVTAGGLKEAPRPVRAKATILTLPAKPLTLVTVIVEAPDEPTRTFNELGLLEIMKPAGGLTETIMFTE